MIELPHGGPGASFRVDALIQYINDSGRDYIIQGQVHCVIADHPKPHSLDYWLRNNYAQNSDTAQASNEVIEALIATELFERGDFNCPDSGHECQGVKLLSDLIV
jgi:hypothetical protein